MFSKHKITKHRKPENGTAMHFALAACAFWRLAVDPLV
jgi:hypothetical protein